MPPSAGLHLDKSDVKEWHGEDYFASWPALGDGAGGWNGVKGGAYEEPSNYYIYWFAMYCHHACIETDLGTSIERISWEAIPDPDIVKRDFVPYGGYIAHTVQRPLQDVSGTTIHCSSPLE